MGGLDGFWADGDGEREEDIGMAALAALGLDDLDAAIARAAQVVGREERLAPYGSRAIRTAELALLAALTPEKP
jgi:hypothetical protein